jgi:hypothetical protein
MDGRVTSIGARERYPGESDPLLGEDSPNWVDASLESPQERGRETTRYEQALGVKVRLCRSPSSQHDSPFKQLVSGFDPQAVGFAAMSNLMVPLVSVDRLAHELLQECRDCSARLAERHFQTRMGGHDEY